MLGDEHANAASFGGRMDARSFRPRGAHDDDGLPFWATMLIALVTVYGTVALLLSGAGAIYRLLF